MFDVQETQIKINQELIRAKNAQIVLLRFWHYNLKNETMQAWKKLTTLNKYMLTIYKK